MDFGCKLEEKTVNKMSLVDRLPLEIWDIINDFSTALNEREDAIRKTHKMLFEELVFIVKENNRFKEEDDYDPRFMTEEDRWDLRTTLDCYKEFLMYETGKHTGGSLNYAGMGEDPVNWKYLEILGVDHVNYLLE